MAVKKNPNYVLPADINQPVIKFLEEKGCSIGAEKIKKMQENIKYGNIELFHDDFPNAKLTVQVDCGMAEGYRKFEIKKSGKWTMIENESVKNKNLDKSKEKKEVVK
jgi:hypothetical protein